MATREHSTATPARPDEPCNWCGRDAWYLPGDYYFGRKKWLCGHCRPYPVFEDTPVLVGKRGRPALNIDLAAICDALKSNRDVKSAARSLGCSRAYIYKIAGLDVIRQCLGENYGN